MFDAIVVGLGGAGSSSAYHLARTGSRTLGLEQYGPVHARGSSHGRTRIYRTAYHEGTEYVAMVRRAQELWKQLAVNSEDRILLETGGLMLGRPDSPTVAGALRSARQLGLEHRLLSHAEALARYPQFALRDDEVAVFDPHAGILFPENCVRAHAGGAVEAGAELHYGERVTGWTADRGEVSVRAGGTTYRGRSLVLTVGPWTASLAADLALPLEIERQFMLWFPANVPDLLGPDRMPVFLWERNPEFHTYGVPDVGDGVKVGTWGGPTTARPEDADRSFGDAQARPAREFAARCLRGLAAREDRHVSCLYTNAPDRAFLIGTHPGYPNVFVVSACSGHGFKFTSVVGEIVARWARGEPAGFDLAPFDPGRFRVGARRP
jgi:sarcosine oxidase